jgi:hypothetical protein
MITQDTVLVQLIRLIERIPSPPPPRRHGRPIFYSEKLFLKSLLIMIVRRLHKVGELLAVLDEPTPEMRMVRELLREEGRFPARRNLREEAQGLAWHPSRADLLPGTPSGRAASTIGEDGKSTRLKQHTSPSQRRSVAQERQRSR